MLSFEKSRPNRASSAHITPGNFPCQKIPHSQLRTSTLNIPEISELETVRHFTQLSQKNFSIETNFYPLGSCTMKYNPRIAHQIAMMPGFLNLHPLAATQNYQGLLESLYDLQEILTTVTGMHDTALSPMAGAQGEFVGIAMIKAYHDANKDFDRSEILVPDAAHGTNPASACACGYSIKEIPTTQEGDLDLEALKSALGPKTAGIMLTNPSTLGVFERDILSIAKLVHEAGGLLYYDGANLNAILGKCRPGDMGFDVMHLNLHKTFATPHGGGGPGAGPVCANKKLAKYLPVPRIAKTASGKYHWLTKIDLPNSIGQLSTFMGNTGVLLRAYIYARLLGKNGFIRVAEYATLNANYLMKKLSDAGFDISFSKRRATHEFIVTLKNVKQQHGVGALDFSKRLLDYGIHAPTMYFPLIIPECLLIEPTETESKRVLDHFIEVMTKILEEAKKNPELLLNAPQTLPVERLDEVKAARDLDLVFMDS